MKPLLLFLISLLVITPLCAEDEDSEAISPAAVGFGNLFIPGLGATLRGKPARGLLEAGLEVGTFVGGTIGNPQGPITIDGTVILPNNENLGRPILGMVLQQVGIKLHMVNTFYHYQQAAIAVETSERELSNPQLLYRGDAGDVLSAPFTWKYLSNPWVYGIILASSAYLFYEYKTTSVDRFSHSVSPANDAFYGATQIGVIPLGSAFGEEPLFRGFLQRETYHYTGSLALALLLQSTLFAALHPSDYRLTAFLSGIYSGLLTQYNSGDLGPAIATHFWIDVIDGIVTYLAFHRQQGKDTPLAPPINLTLGFRF